MNKEKRKRYKIKQMRQSGMSYIDIGRKINTMKEIKTIKKPPKNTISRQMMVGSSKSSDINLIKLIIRKIYEFIKRI